MHDKYRTIVRGLLAFSAGASFGNGIVIFADDADVWTGILTMLSAVATFVAVWLFIFKLRPMHDVKAIAKQAWAAAIDAFIDDTEKFFGPNRDEKEFNKWWSSR